MFSIEFVQVLKFMALVCVFKSSVFVTTILSEEQKKLWRKKQNEVVHRHVRHRGQHDCYVPRQKHVQVFRSRTRRTTKNASGVYKTSWGTLCTSGRKIWGPAPIASCRCQQQPDQWARSRGPPDLQHDARCCREMWSALSKMSGWNSIQVSLENMNNL